jgi:hypothetical protein
MTDNSIQHFRNVLFDIHYVNEGSVSQRPDLEAGIVETMKLYNKGTPEEIAKFEQLVNRSVQGEASMMEALNYLKMVVGGLGTPYTPRFQ